jgi:hypothetical protein
VALRSTQQLHRLLLRLMLPAMLLQLLLLLLRLLLPAMLLQLLLLLLAARQ